MIDKTKLARLATIEIVLHDEDSDPIDHFGYDTEAENQEAAAFVRDLANRSQWGWCVVEVIASYGGMVGRDVLGGCSYESEDAFKSDGYYTDMVGTALDELACALEAIDACLVEVRS